MRCLVLGIISGLCNLIQSLYLDYNDSVAPMYTLLLSTGAVAPTVYGV
jgi:hypothetical protein